MEKEYKRIQTRAELKEWLAVETARYPNSGKYRLMNLLMLGENAILRRHQILLRKTEYYINSGHRVLAKLYKLRLLQFQIKYGMHIPPNTFGRGLHVMHVGDRCERTCQGRGELRHPCPYIPGRRWIQ